MDNLYRLIRTGIKASQLTVGQVAEHIGVSRGVVNNKLNPFCGSNHLSLQEFIGIADATADMEPLRQVAHEFGYDLVERNVTPGHCVATQAVNTSAELGSLMRAVQDATADGKITLEELKVIQAEGQKLTDAIGVLIATASQQAKSNVTTLEQRS